MILYATEVILIIATTLMHQSTLSTNNFGNNHIGQKYQNFFLEFSGDYNGLFGKFPTNRAKTRICVFGQSFHSFDNFVTLKNKIWNFISSIDASDVSATADIICRRKSFQKLLENLS